MSIVLMGVGVLAAVSAVVGFNGWPGSAAGSDETPRAMLAQSDPYGATRDQVRAPRVVVPDSRPEPARVRFVRPVLRAGTDGVVRQQRVAERTGASIRPTLKPLGNTVAAGHDKKDPPDGPVDPVADPVRQAGADLGSATNQTAEGLGKAVEPVSPTLAKTVDDAGQVVGDTIQGVTNSVADLLTGVIKPVLPPPAPAPIRVP